MGATGFLAMKRKRSFTHLLMRFGLLGLFVVGCALSVAPTNSADRQIALELAAFPDRLSAEDSTSQAEIWATIKRGDKPVADSTLVVFATTAGTITASVLTRDGLAVAVLTSPGDGRPQRVEIIAQALTIRDTLEVDFILTQ
ncbi:MAG: hypothetical protein ACI8PG_005246 [Planctomycetota bacterium]|jgi:hypothetical protein